MTASRRANHKVVSLGIWVGSNFPATTAYNFGGPVAWEYEYHVVMYTATSWGMPATVDRTPDRPCPFPDAFRDGRPGDLCDFNHFWSNHPGGANFALADGSVRFIPYSAAKVLVALGTRNGGEVVGDY